nr:flavoprotein [Xenorhabdus cabanillasii]
MAAVAHGTAPNRLTTVILSSTFPVLFFPVMGNAMWEKKKLPDAILPNYKKMVIS